MALKGYDMDKATHWATTQCGKWPIKVYSHPLTPRLDGITIFEPLHQPYVLIREKLFLPKHAERFDEVLLHEFVHVCENVFWERLAQPSPEDCSNYAIVLGEHLTRMLKTLKRV